MTRARRWVRAAIFCVGFAALPTIAFGYAGEELASFQCSITTDCHGSIRLWPASQRVLRSEKASLRRCRETVRRLMPRRRPIRSPDQPWRCSTHTCSC